MDLLRFLRDVFRGIFPACGMERYLNQQFPRYEEADIMADFSISEMQEMQNRLQEKYRDKWEPICPETGKNKLLWLIGEIGEVIDIVKKNGSQKAVADPSLRKDLIEEMADVLMYYNDVMLCYGISADELKKAYTEKFEKNMQRW